MADTRTAVQPGTKRWEELVREGIIKDGQRNWYLGDAALEIAPMRDQRGPGDGELENLQQYADEIGIEYGSILKYRQVAKSWLIENRVSNTCWKVHQMLATHPELIKQGMTVTLAHAALGQKNVGRTGPQADTKAKAAAVQDYLSDPEVAKKALADPATASAVVAAAPVPIIQAQDAQRKAAAASRESSSGSQQKEARDNFTRAIEVQRVLSDLDNLRRDVASLSSLGRVRADDAEALAVRAGRSMAALQWLADLKSEDLNLSDEVASWLESQS